MPRYIDLEEFERRIKKYIKPEIPEEKEFVEWCTDECIRQGYAMATADVQEVRHGHWIEKDLDNFRKVECSCSICGWSGVENYDSYVDIHDFEFCPNCGAKMDNDDFCSKGERRKEDVDA